MRTKFPLKELGVALLLSSACLSQTAIAEGECNAEVCAEDPDFDLWAETVDTSIQTARETRDGLYEEATETAFAVKEKLDSQTCLDAIRGLDINAVLIDPMYTGLLGLQQMVLDLIDQGCSMISDAVNAQTAEFNGKINAVGDQVSEATMGLADLGAEASENQNVSMDYELDEAVLNDIVNDVNSDINTKFFGDTPPPNSQPISLQSTNNPNNPTPTAGNLAESPTIDELMDDATCWLGRDCEQTSNQ